MSSDNTTQNDYELKITLAILRLSTAFFMGIWALDKIFNSDRAMQTISKYYLGVDSSTIVLGLGIIQLIIVVLFAAGLFKTLTYGAVFAMHATSVIASIPVYMTPFARPSILFWAAIPVLAGIILLFVLRRKDCFLTVGK